jgi:hypothetical protein
MAWEEHTNQLSDAELETLKRSDLGPLNFELATGNLRKIRTWAELLDRQDPEDLFAGLRGEMGSHLGTVVSLAAQIKAFDVNAANSPTERQSLITQIDNEREWFAQAAVPYIRGGEIDVAQLLQQAQTAVEAVTGSAAEAEQLIGKIRTVAGEAGAQTLSTHYRTQAKSHGDQAMRFLIAGVVALVVTAVLGILLFVLNPPSAAETENWLIFARALVPRLFLVGVVAYVVAFSARNYRVNKHLQVVNLQKQTALDTYPLFTQSVTDDATRGLIAVELLRATVGAADTGYISAGSEKSILEMQPGITQILRPPGT